MSAPAPRTTFARALRIAGYNWPLYATAGVVLLIGVILACLSEMKRSFRLLAGAGAAVAGWFAFASFWAFHSMFDRSELLGGQWLKEEIAQAPNRWVQINAGLEETTLPLAEVFPAAEGTTLDLFDPAVMTEPAVTRARLQKGEVAAIPIQPDALPVEDGWAELVVVMLAAHEIRNGQKRRQFFEELRRIVSPTGKIIVVEHLRDLAAALAFGPGIFHFFPRGEWLWQGRSVGLEVERERRITPFVRVFVYRVKESRNLAV